jgi:hypothetical protein
MPIGSSEAIDHFDHIPLVNRASSFGDQAHPHI